MRHVTRVNESYHTCESYHDSSVASRKKVNTSLSDDICLFCGSLWTYLRAPFRHVTRVNRIAIPAWLLLQVLSHVAHVNESWRTCERVMAHM